MSDILDEAFKNPDLELDTPLVDEYVDTHLPRGTGSTGMESLEEQERLRVELFGGQLAVAAEYDGRTQIRHLNRHGWRR